MSPCEVSSEALWALADGEAGAHSWGLAEHRRGCPLCQSRLGELAEMQAGMTARLHASTRHIDTLAALRHIRLRHELQHGVSLTGQVREWVAWRWTFAGPWIFVAGGAVMAAAAALAWRLCTAW